MSLHVLPWLFGAGLLATGQATAHAQDPLYGAQVRPFLAKYCLSCHGGDDPKGELSLESLAAMRKGGKSGPALVIGKPDESILVLHAEKKKKPAMPPSKSLQPKAEEIGILRRWIVAGAKEEVGTSARTLPRISPTAKREPPVTALAYHPEGKVLALGQHREIRIVESATGEGLQSVAVPEGVVTAVAFDSKGGSLAVAASSMGQSAVIYLYDFKEQLAQKPRQRLAGHADMVLAMAFSGDRLATAGYDRQIKLWDVGTGKELRTLKDHSDTVYGLAWQPGGKLLASAAADRAVKIWDPQSGKRLQTLGESTDWLYAVAWSPDGAQVAAGGVDKSIRFWDVSSNQAKLLRSVFAHEGPVTRLVFSRDGKKLYSLGEDRVAKAWNAATFAELQAYAKQPDTVLCLGLRPDRKQLALGRYDGGLVLLDEASGTALPAIPPDRFRTQAEVEPNDSPSTGMLVDPPVSLAGKLSRAGAVDFYRFSVKAGEELGIELTTTAKPAAFEPVLTLLDGNAMPVAQSESRHLGYRFTQSGYYSVGVRDRDYRGGSISYRLHLGPIPIVISAYPLGIQRGTEASVRLDGVFLGQGASVKVKADAAARGRLPVIAEAPTGKPLGSVSLEVGEFPELIGPGHLSPPMTGNGRLAEPGSADLWTFTAKKGQPLIVEIAARRLGSPLDSTVEILDKAGKPAPRARLQALAQSYVTFRDHDSVSPGIRMETWHDFSINDFVWTGTQLLRIFALPKNPDDDCQFYSLVGQRQAFLDTTTTHLSNGSPMYRVAIHPPGSKFPASGLPVIDLDYRNDDGGPGFGKDSRITFDPPADGEYRIRVRDARGWGGPAFAYRLTVRPPQPRFTIAVNPMNPAVWKGGALPITITTTRIDGFDGPIDLRLDGLPTGFSAPDTSILPGENSTSLALSASATATAPRKEGVPPKVVATAKAANRQLREEAPLGLPSLREKGDLTAQALQQAISVSPGKETTLTLRIERQGDFKGRVPIEVRGLPHGVRVLDIGLNGILITEKETERTFTIFAEPWVKPMDHPFVVLAKSERKGTEHAAQPVLLRIVGNQPQN